MLLCLLNLPLRAQTDPAEARTASLGSQKEFVRHAELARAAARDRLEKAPDDPEAAWQYARACFDLADLAATREQRAEIANEGCAACRKLIEKHPDSAPGHYYLGMNLGELARTKRLGALKIVDQMEKEFTTAIRLDPAFDHAGPDRNLGLLYLEAPGWPVSIGNRYKAQQHLQKALKAAPRYPENLLNLIDAELRWEDDAGAQRELQTLDQLWPVAQKEFTGPEWAAAWADWSKRRADLQKSITAPPKEAKPGRRK